MLSKEFYLERLQRWDNLYHNLGTPEVTDTEYDILRSEFKRVYPNDPYFKKVGETITLKYEKIDLPFVLGGLDKVDTETVNDWAKKKKDIIIDTEKLDGNSIACTWENNILTFAASRGDSKSGQNILNKGKYFIPSIPVREKVSLRGEILLEGDLFKELGFKNRRNAVTGILRRDEINPNILKKLSVIFYEVIEAPIELKRESDRLTYISKILKLRIPRWGFINLGHIGLPETLSELLLKYKEDASYDIDGLVLTYENSVRENVEFPKSKVKFKLNETAVKCKVINIEWDVTRIGFIKPVVVIEPTEILGATVSRCSGFNYNFIECQEIGIGSEIGVVRSGDVIPFITEIYKTAPTNIPTRCPSCNGPLIKTYNNLGNPVDLKCENDKCKQKMIYTISHFFIEMGCDNISDRTIEMIGVYNIEDMYNLKVEDLEILPGFGKKKAEMIINEVKKTLHIKPEKLIAAFGIPLIGTSISKSLCSKFSIDELFEIKNPEVLGLGPITSQTFIDNINKYKYLYQFLWKKGLKFIEEDKSLKILQGMKFALTGAGPLKRKEYEKMVEEKGGEVKGISKDTDYLVTDDTSTNSEKIKAANKYGTKIINYDEFMHILR